MRGLCSNCFSHRTDRSDRSCPRSPQTDQIDHRPGARGFTLKNRNKNKKTRHRGRCIQKLYDDYSYIRLVDKDANNIAIKGGRGWQHVWPKHLPGGHLSEETARKGGQRRQRSAALRNDILSVRTIVCIRIFMIFSPVFEFISSYFVRALLAQTLGHTPQVDNRTCREYNVTTLPPISISSQHGACVIRPSAL